MILVSTRQSLTNSDEFSEDTTYFSLNFTVGGAAKTTKRTASSIKKLLDKKRVLLLVHGYNNDFADVSRAYSIIETKFSEIDHDYDEIVGFTWPGGNQGYEYHPAKRRSSVAAGRLLDLNNDIQFKSLDIMTHSMGARVVLRALCELDPQGPAAIRNHFATAAAVDDESIEKDETFYSATQIAEANWIFHSKNDDVLKYWYRIGDLDTALGLHGPDDRQAIERHSKNVKVINCRHYVNGHGGYKNTPEFYWFISDILSGEIPKSRQFFTL